MTNARMQKCVAPGQLPTPNKTAIAYKAQLSVGGRGLIAAAQSVETPRWCQKPVENGLKSGFSVRF
jgi:hypothetical protein